MQHVYTTQYGYLLNKYLKCSVWMLAVRYDIKIYVVKRQRINTALERMWKSASSRNLRHDPTICLKHHYLSYCCNNSRHILHGE
jgi:hypothetical protein